MSAPERKERWIVLDDIPGIAMRDEIIIVRPDQGIIVGRWLPLSRYDALMESRRLLRLPSPLPYRVVRYEPATRLECS